MPNLRFRLARVLHWYEKQYQLEQSRLQQAMERLRSAEADLKRHRQEVLASRDDVVRASTVQAHELASLVSFRRRAEQRDLQLSKISKECEGALIRQRATTQKAHMRLRLVEKLKERRLAEYTYNVERELETLASEVHLGAVARSMGAESTS